MPTPRKKASLPDTQGVALVPVNAAGDIIHGAGAYEMPDEPDYLRDEPEQEAIEPTATDRIASLLDDSVTGDDKAVVKVFRKLPSGKQSWCDDYTPQDFEAGGMKQLRERHGAGEFVITLYGSQPQTGKFVIRKRAEITIEPGPTTSVASTTGESPALIALLEKLTTQAPIAPPPPPDPMAEMQRMFGMMTMMREAMGLNTQQKSSVGEMVDAIKELRSAKDLIEGKSDEDESMMGLAKSILPMVGQAIQNRQQAPAPAPSAPLPPIDSGYDAAGVPLQALNAPTQETDPMTIAEQAAALKLKMAVGVILKMAELNLDPAEGAKIIYEKLPDEWIEMLATPVWFPMLVDQVPQAKPYEAWLTKARDIALGMFNQEDEGDSELPDDNATMEHGSGDQSPAK